MSAENEFGLGVQVGSEQPGVSPVAFICVVEVIDADGEKHHQIIESNGLTDSRRIVLRSVLDVLPASNGKAHAE